MELRISIIRKIPILRSLNRKTKALIAKIIITAPGNKPPFKLVVFPPFSDNTELLDFCYKIKYFLPKHLIGRVSIAITSTIPMASMELPIPDYLKATPIPINSFEWIKSCQKIRYQRRLMEADYILIWDKKSQQNNLLIRKLEQKVIKLDRHELTWDGWVWSTLGNTLISGERLTTPVEAQIRFNQYVKSLPKYKKAYVFGTGPSLDTAYQFDFSDGYRIVCNTIVKNQRLLKHISPHFIVAADAIYHFANNLHAYQFRRDLESALDLTQAMFLTSDFFVYLLKYHHPRIYSRTIPVRTDLIGMDPNGIYLDMKNNLAYTGLPNILNSLLLPLGTSLANEINLLGFDGRAPNEISFWQNSGANSYEELKPTIKAAHPGFFTGIDYEEYAHSQSNSAEKIMTLGEQMGKKYYCLNQSFIPAMQKRIHPKAIRYSNVKT